MNTFLFAGLDVVHDGLNRRVHGRINVHGDRKRVLSRQVLRFRDDRIDIGLICIGVAHTPARSVTGIDQRIFHLNCFSQIIFFGGDITVTSHQVENRIAPRGGMIEKVVRIVRIRSVDDPRQHGRLGQIELAGRFSIIIFRRFFNAADISGAAEIHFIQIHFEDRLFVGYFFQLLGQIDLLYFIGDGTGSGLPGFVILKIRQLHQLHGEGGAARQSAPPQELVFHVVQCRLGEAGDIKSVVIKIAAVFHRQKSVDQRFADLVIGDIFAELGTDVGNLVSVFIKDMRAFK